MAPMPCPRCCPIRRVAVHLRPSAGELVRILWLTADGEFSCQLHWLPLDLALILASNQRLIMGSVDSSPATRRHVDAPMKWTGVLGCSH